MARHGYRAPTQSRGRISSWRSRYVFVYAAGEALLTRWLEAVPGEQREERFERLLHEQLTPEAVRVLA